MNEHAEGCAVERTIHDAQAWHGRCRVHDCIPLARACNGRDTRRVQVVTTIAEVISAPSFSFFLAHLAR